MKNYVNKTVVPPIPDCWTQPLLLAFIQQINRPVKVTFNGRSRETGQTNVLLNQPKLLHGVRVEVKGGNRTFRINLVAPKRHIETLTC